MTFKPVLALSLAAFVATPAFSQGLCPDGSGSVTASQCTSYGGTIEQGANGVNVCRLGEAALQPARDELCIGLPQATGTGGATLGGAGIAPVIGAIVLVGLVAGGGSTTSTTATTGTTLP